MIIIKVRTVVTSGERKEGTSGVPKKPNSNTYRASARVQIEALIRYVLIFNRYETILQNIKYALSSYRDKHTLKTAWKARCIQRIRGFPKVPCRNMMVQGELATGPLPIGLFPIPHSQGPHTQACSHLHSQIQAPFHTLLSTHSHT